MTPHDILTVVVIALVVVMPIAAFVADLIQKGRKK